MPILMSAANPNGAKLEDLLRALVAEIEEKCQRIAGDTRPEAQTVLHNNHQIMGLLTTALRHQEHSMKVLEAVGPNQGPTGKPRIGVGS